MIRFLQTPSTTKKIVLGGLLLIICAAMVITLVPGGFLGDAFGFGGPGKGVLAKVGDQEITLMEAQRTARQLLQQRLGSRVGNTSALVPLFVSQAVNELVSRKAMLVEAERMGLRVSDQELADYLRKSPELFPNGQFIGGDRYEDYTERAFNMTVPQFEEAVKSDVLLGKLTSVVTGAVTVSDEQVRQEYVKRNTKVKFQYATLTVEDVMKQIQPAEAELKAFFEKNKKGYENSIPEMRKFQYIVVDTSGTKEKVQVTPAELKSYYDSHIDQFRVPEEVKVRHILIKTPAPGANGKVDQKAIDEARSKAEDILKKIKAGASFAEMAKKFSEDPGSAREGGELGWIGRGRTVPEFEKAAFSLPPGQISGVVQSSYGFHILQVEDKHVAHLKPLDEVKSEIEPLIAQQKAANAAESLANTLQSETRTTGMANAAAKHGLELKTSPLVARTDTVAGIGSAPEFMSAVFSVREKNPPQMVHLPQGYALFQVTEIKPPATPTFEQAKARVEEDFKRERSQSLLAQKLQELSDRARAQHDLKKAADEAGATLKTSDLVGPDSQVPGVGSLSGPIAVVFDMKPGTISEPISTGRGGVVISLLEKQEPSPAGFDAQKDEIRESLLDQKRSQMLGLFIDGVRQRMEREGKIRINKQAIDRLLPKPEAS